MTDEQLEKAGFSFVFNKWPGWRKALYWDGLDGYLVVNLISRHYLVDCKYGEKTLILPDECTPDELKKLALNVLCEIFTAYCIEVGKSTEIIINADLS